MIEIRFMEKYKKVNYVCKKGMTFSEVIVTIAIFSIVMVGVNQLFIKSWQNYNLVMHTNEASVAANRGMSTIIDVLRRLSSGADGSYPILNASSFDLKIFSDIDKDGVMERVHYYLNGTDLMVGKSNPAYPAVNTDSETEILIKNVVNTAAQPLFYYYDGVNNTIANPNGSLNTVRMIEVNLFIDRREGDLNIESYASLRNLSEHDTIE